MLETDQFRKDLSEHGADGPIADIPHVCFEFRVQNQSRHFAFGVDAVVGVLDDACVVTEWPVERQSGGVGREEIVKGVVLWVCDETIAHFGPGDELVYRFTMIGLRAYHGTRSIHAGWGRSSWSCVGRSHCGILSYNSCVGANCQRASMNMVQ